MTTPVKHAFNDGRLDHEVWLIDEDGVWRVWCMDCGYRIGTVQPHDGQENDAIRLTRDHARAMHL